MDGHVLLLVLAAALLHATWNSIVKGGSNKLFESSMNALGGGLGALLILPFLPAPAPESWGLLALSCCFHLTYYICISQAYDKVDLSMGYTIMRGCAPMITALALLLLGNHISLTGWGGVLLLCLGILTLTLCGGDAFHLVPRIFRAFRGSTPKIKHLMGTGLQISSITMTAFYVILLFIWKLTFPDFTAPAAVEVMIWASAIIRIAVCLLPQNNWCTDEGNLKLSILRNGVFAVTGIGVMILYAISGNAGGYHMTKMVAAILISFGCYLPVTLFSKTKPKVGLLMIPKTCAYMWIIAMGLQLLGSWNG